ncbi:ankyrin repeat domain-containing protein [Lysobacter sp. CA199]|uniref:ankyrin repeat domain-containing protein n=1 Tax=Lysobacter sp. CA199 TaxID=3455608 RepID=UPI003F8D5E9C
MRAATLPALTICLILAGVACRGEAMDAKQAFPDPRSAELAQAVADGDAARVRTLVQAGADPDARGDRGVNLLQYAMLAQSPRGLQALLDSGADPSRPGMGGSTAVHGAAIANDPQYLTILLAHRADPNVAHAETGETPLADAAAPRYQTQFDALLKAGADPDRADRMGNTPLHQAAKLNASGQVLALLEAGADPRARNRQGASFQAFLFKIPADKLNPQARAEREAVVAWLEEHEVAVETGGP